MQSARNRNRAPCRKVKVGEFFRAEFGRAVHRRARFVHYDIIYGAVAFLNQLGNEYFRFLACRAVSYRNNVDIVLGNKVFENFFRFFRLALRRRGINYRIIEHVAVRVDNGYFATRSVRGVKPQNNFAFKRRLQQERL